MNRTLMLVVPCIAAVVLLQGQTKIRQTPIQPTSPASGQEMFMAYCASCHGKDGRGAGPAAPALKAKPTDLTMLSKKNGGKFPEVIVRRYIQGDDEVAAHGSRDMPIWGNLFKSLPGGEGGAVLRVNLLVNYVKALQK